jgi:hypothetical protein
MIGKLSDRLARERMAIRPFVPAGNPDIRETHAQEYSAFYLGEISTHLEKLAASAEKIEKSLDMILSRMNP